MFLSKIKLSCFRNFFKADVSNFNKLNVFLGDNGQGKTNLLESIHFLCSGEGIHFGEKTNFILEKKDQSLIQGEFLKQKQKIKVSIQKDQINCFLGEKKTTKKQLKNNFPTIVFQPRHLKILQEEASLRRKFLDETILNIFSEKKSSYKYWEKAYQSKNAILLDLKRQKKTKIQAEKELLQIDPIYQKASLEITQLRLDFLEKIEALFKENLKNLFDSFEVGFSYIFLKNEGFRVKNSLEKLFFERQKELRQKELDIKQNLIGAHKDELIFCSQKKDLRFYASQGQQRSVILSFKMAEACFYEAKKAKKPLFLLDDVFSELDELRQKKLLDFFQKNDFQCFITTTHHPPLFREKNYPNLNIYSIKKGSIF